MACNADHEMMEKTCKHIVSVISQNYEMRVLVWSNKDSNNIKREFLIQSTRILKSRSDVLKLRS
jgi:hypothetical protein